ncbi:reverse transcriptase domain-containing protein [Tanacetum coccineum]
MIAKRVAEALEAYDAARNPGTETNRVEQQDAKSRPMHHKATDEVSCSLKERDSENIDGIVKFTRSIDLLLINQRFQSDSLCTKMVPEERIRLKAHWRSSDNNQREGYTIKNAENKRRFDNKTRDNRRQQQPFRRHNVNGQNMARAYTVGNNVERKAYVGNLPYCNKCRMHYEGPCMVKCGNCKRVGHMTRDCRTAVVATSQRAPVGNQTRCYLL